MTVLVLDAHTRAGVEVTQSLGRRGIVVDVAAENHCAAFCSRRIRRSFKQPSAAQPDHFLPWLRSIEQENNYSLIVPSSEISLNAFLPLPDSDPLRSKAILSSNASLQIALDKSLTLRVASNLRIPAPETTLIRPGDAISAFNSYPAILKPVSSQALVGGIFEAIQPRIVRNDFERREQLRGMLQKTAVLQQELVSGRGVGVGMLYRRGQLVWYFCHERLHEGSGAGGLGGGSTYRRSIQADPLMLRHCVTLLDELRWHGVAQVEFKVSDDGRFWLMEINPRLWGSVALAIDAGVDFPYGLLCLASDREVAKQPDYKIHQYTRYFWDDLDWLRTRLRYRLDAAAFKELVKLLRPIAGLETWDHFDWGDLSVTFAEARSFLSTKLDSVRKKLAKARRAKTARKVHKRNLQRILASRQKPRKLLFLCYGNICRSPVSELLAKKRCPQLEVRSAGFHPTVGRSSPPHIQDLARAFSIELSGWSSTRVEVDLVRSADVIFLYDMLNYDAFLKEFPDSKSKILFLGMFLSKPSLEIKDPYQSNSSETRQILEEISSAIDDVVKHILDPLDTASIRKDERDIVLER